MKKQFGWGLCYVLIFILIIIFAGVDRKIDNQHVSIMDKNEESQEAYIILDYLVVEKNVHPYSICMLFSECRQDHPFFKKQVKTKNVQIAKSTANRVATEIIKESTQPMLDPNGKYIALTFDDGPSLHVTPRILDVLKEHGIKATFFMLGSQVQYHPLLVKRVAEEGHEIGNHTFSHARLIHLDEDKVRQEIEQTDQIIKEVIGEFPSSFRPPYGDYNELVQKITSEKEEPIILWSVDSLDWKNRNAEVVMKMVLDHIHPGSIVLLHDIHPTTADALPAILTALIVDGYQFVSVSELLSLDETVDMGPFYGFK